MGENKVASLVFLYDKFRNPDFVIKQNHVFEENGRRVYTVKLTVSVPVLGSVTFGSVYIESAKQAIPMMFLSREQVKLLHDNEIHVFVRKRKHANGTDVYICVPNRRVLSRIDSL